MAKNKLPEELFNSFGENIKYRFINLSGKETEVWLGESDYLSKQKCPLDGTNFVMVDDGVYKHEKHCYCCGGPFLNTALPEEMAEEWITKEYSKGIEEEITITKANLRRLEKHLEISTNRNSEILEKNRNNSRY